MADQRRAGRAGDSLKSAAEAARILAELVAACERGDLRASTIQIASLRAASTVCDEITSVQ